jgi:hypothetical protein
MWLDPLENCDYNIHCQLEHLESVLFFQTILFCIIPTINSDHFPKHH